MAMGKIYRSAAKATKRRGRPRKVAPAKLNYVVKKAIKYSGESKYFYTQYGTSNVDWNGNLIILSNVPQGTTDVTRIGDVMIPTSLEIKGQMVLNQAARDFCMARMIIFRWLQDTSDTTPNVADVLDYVGSDQVTNSAIVHDKRRDYNIIYDSGPQSLVTFGTTGYNNKMFNINKRIKLAGKEVHYIAATTDGRNHLYALLISDVSSVYLPYGRFVFKLNFKD